MFANFPSNVESVEKRLSKICDTTVTRNVEKILAAKQMLQPPTTLVPKFTWNQQLSNHVCHEIGISYSFASNQGFSPIFFPQNS